MASGRSFIGSRSVIGGSDEVVSLECESCKFDDSWSEGVAFCETCDEYLCKACASVHKKNKATRSHKIIEGQYMLKTSTLVGSDSDEDYCDVHKDKEIKFYCETHDLVLCDVCKDIDHRQCDGMVSIEDAVKGEKWTAKAEGEIDQVRQLINDFKELKSQRNVEYSEFKIKSDKCRKEMKVLRDKLNTILDRLEQDMHDKLSKADRENTYSLTDSQIVADDSIQSLEKAVSSVQSIRKTGDDKKGFIAMKKARRRKLSDVVTNLSSKSVEILVKFEADPALLNIINNLQLLGQLTITTQTTRACGDATEDHQLHLKGYAPSVMANEKKKKTTQTDNRAVLKDKKAGTIREFRVRESSDTRSCHIGGAQFLEDGRLVVIDDYNMKVKILNSKLTIQSSVTVQCVPYDISLINQQEAVVSLGEISKLQYVKLSPRLKRIRQVKTRLECKGVVCHNSKLYVSCVDKAILVVLVLNLLGQEETIIRTDVKCNRPDCITADTRGYLYISDCLAHMVVCITVKGEVVYKYTHNTLKGPISLLLDTENNVLVCGFHSHNVQVISDTGTYHNDIIPPREGGVAFPVSLAYRRSDNTLVVGVYGNDMMLSFRLE